MAETSDEAVERRAAAHRRVERYAAAAKGDGPEREALVARYEARESDRAARQRSDLDAIRRHVGKQRRTRA